MTPQRLKAFDSSTWLAARLNRPLKKLPSGFVLKGHDFTSGSKKHNFS